MVFKCIFFLNDSKNKMHFSQHLLLRISRHFTGWNVLNLAVSCLPYPLSQPPVGGKTLGAFQSIIIDRNTIYFYVQLFFFPITRVFFFLCPSQLKSQYWVLPVFHWHALLVPCFSLLPSESPVCLVPFILPGRVFEF